MRNSNRQSLKIQSLKFENLVFGFESQDPLFNKVDFEFPMDQIVWTRASSGSGRSSLLQLMAGLQSPQFGKYFINEENVSDMSFEEFLPYRLNIGYGFDFGGLINNRSLLENVTLPIVYHEMMSVEEANEKMRKYFDLLGAGKFVDQRPALVPGGMRKLVCLIRAIATSPDVVLLDDPSVGLGQETILKFFDIIQGLRDQGKCRHVFINSFDEKLMNCLDHTEIFLEEGQIYQDLASDNMKKVVCL